MSEYISPSMSAQHQMLRWREATGMEHPTTVPLSCSLTVGRFTLTATTDRFPLDAAKSILQGKSPRKRTARKPPALLTLTGPRGGGASGRKRTDDAQRGAYNDAMATGAWA